MRTGSYTFDVEERVRHDGHFVMPRLWMRYLVTFVIREDTIEPPIVTVACIQPPPTPTPAMGDYILRLGRWIQEGITAADQRERRCRA